MFEMERTKIKSISGIFTHVDPTEMFEFDLQVNIFKVTPYIKFKGLIELLNLKQKRCIKYLN